MAKKTSTAQDDVKAALRAEKKEQKQQARGKQLWKLIATFSALLAGLAMARALDATWKTATGHAAPTKPENPDIGTRESLTWAAISGMAIGVAKTYATRRAANYWVKSTGRLPPGMDPAESSQPSKAVG